MAEEHPERDGRRHGRAEPRLRVGTVGNLTQRRDVNQSNLTETFFYDNLHRLDYSQRNGSTHQDLAYDLLGNITSKMDVGSYAYHATKKHQVVSTGSPTSWSFGYDANGNMTSGRGASIAWTSYNYPSCIRLGAACSGTTSDYSSFEYTPDRQYWRQVSNYTSGGTATTIYAGGLYEKVTTSSGTEYRHYIRAGGSTIIVSRQSSGTVNNYYVTSDHLGSSSAITNSSGGVLVNSSFDAFGKRRGANWSGSPGAGDWTAIAGTTRRGFTEHSMLDNLGLIHMNGRVKDPLLGRFVSADPFITEPLNTQNYNRYSYVYNNPLRFIDPSGFDGHDCQESRGSAGCTPQNLQEVVVTGNRFCDAACMAARADQTMHGSLSTQANAEASQVAVPMEEVVVTGIRPQSQKPQKEQSPDIEVVCQPLGIPGVPACTYMTRDEADVIADQHGALAVAGGAFLGSRVGGAVGLAGWRALSTSTRGAIIINIGRLLGETGGRAGRPQPPGRPPPYAPTPPTVVVPRPSPNTPWIPPGR